MASVNKKRMMDGLIAFLIAGGSAVVTSWGVNTFLPSSAPLTRSGLQFGAGFVPLLFAKNRLIRYAGLGSAFSGFLGAVEKTTGLKTLAGDAGGTLSRDEIALLQSVGALPRLNGPVNLHRPMNGPATMRNPSMAGGFAVPS